MAKRKAKKKESKALSSFLFIFSWFVVGLITIVLLVGIGYYYGYKEGTIENSNVNKKEIHELRKTIKKLQSSTKKSSSVSNLNKKLHTVLKLNRKEYATAAHEYVDAKGSVTAPPKAVKRKLIYSSSRPKLAIIIDDVSFSRDIKAIKNLDMPLTMAFLPPSDRHPNSATLAKDEPFYMVHLPLEAMRFNSEEPFTLHVNDSQSEISERIGKIKKLFPRVKYINNHTGSKFTADEAAVNRLIFTLRRNGIKFIDSRTTAQTKVPDVMQNYGSEYVARDVFLDHVADVAYIKKQIQKAVDKAKKHGSAIAIGHPRSETLQALAESKDILQDIDLVRIDSLI
ncbi:MAG: divergent polysaccharide deacetylase family protein [Campylobacterota bacterium]|nr:divergent polysaccharide deacetylase family protein [Campylobacterota bacterium]